MYSPFLSTQAKHTEDNRKSSDTSSETSERHHSENDKLNHVKSDTEEDTKSFGEGNASIICDEDIATGTQHIEDRAHSVVIHEQGMIS